MGNNHFPDMTGRNLAITYTGTLAPLLVFAALAAADPLIWR